MSEIEKFDIDNFDTNSNYVIEASAGTGKTYSIIEMLKKLTASEGYKDKYDVEKLNKILVVTYTEKATQELKDRIRRELNVSIENASVFTIHSFCKYIADTFPISSNLPTNLTMMSEEDIDAFINDYVRKGHIFEEYNKYICYFKDSKIENIVKNLKESLKKYYLNSNYKEDEKIISIDEEKYKEDILLIKGKDIFSKIDNIDDLPDEYQEYKDHYHVLQSSTEVKLRELSDILKPSTYFYYNGKDYKTSKKYSEEEKEAIEFFKNKRDKLKGIKMVDVLPLKYLKDLYKSLSEYKKENKLQTFDDMIRNVREEILKPDSKLKEKLKEKYTPGIIDEFQDTNQKQFDIFSSIFLEDDSHHLIVVGDPKQSIYGFQGSDLNVYNNAKDIIKSKGKLERLQTNYRSTDKMVVSCNKLFKEYKEEALDNEIFKEFQDSGESGKYESKYFDEEKKEFVENQAFWIIDEEVDEYEYAKAVCQQIVNCCLKNETGKTNLQLFEKDKERVHNVTFKDFTILYKSRSESYAIKSELKKAGIPFIVVGDLSLFNENAAYSFKTLFEAIDAEDFVGKNRTVFKKALLTPFFNLKIKDINKEKYNKDDSSEMDEIIRYKEIAKDKRWEDLIDEILYSSKLIETLNTINDIQQLGYYKQIATYCIDYLSKNHTIKDLIDNLTRLENDSSEDNGDSDDDKVSKVEKTTDFNAVTLSTMHASKGLQYPVTIVVGGFKGPNKQQAKYSRYDKEAEKNLLYKYSFKDYEQEDIQEAKRLFYVAYTRAQYVLMLPSYDKFGFEFLKTTLNKYKSHNPNDYKSFSIPTKEEEKCLKDKVREILNYKNGRKGEDKDKDNKVNNDKLVAKKQTLLTYKHSYSSLSHPKETEESRETDEITIEGKVDKEGSSDLLLTDIDKKGAQIEGELTKNTSDKIYKDHSSFIKGTQIGTALHEIFEKTDFTNLTYLEKTISRIMNKYNLHLTDEDQEYIKEIITNVLNAEFIEVIGSKQTGNTFKLNELTPDDRKNEIEFNFNMDSTAKDKLRNYCNGFMDLLFKRNINGMDVYSVLDYKSDSLNDDFLSYEDNSELKKHTDSHYSIQRVLYSYCLIKFLKSYYKDTNEEEIFKKHFGGIYYVYIKGCYSNTKNGIYVQTWNSYSDLENSYKEIIKFSKQK